MTTNAPCPVCGNPLNPVTVPRAMYRNQTYAFRCPGCRERFLADPERYLAATPTGCGHAGGGCGGHDGDGRRLRWPA